MATASIVIQQNDSNQIPQSRDDLVLGTIVTLLNQSDIGVTSWLWQMVDKPQGSNASLSGLHTASVTFVPDVVGTYLIKLTVNYASSSPSTDQKGAAIKTTNLKYRIPAASEEGEFDPTRGWAAAVDYALQKLDDAYGLEEANSVSPSRTISAGYGLVGGGDLSADRSFALATSGVTAAQYNIGNGSITFDAYGRATNAVQATNIASTSRLINTVSGQLTGGGDLSADRTLGLAAFGTAGSYNNVITDAYGRVQSGSNANYALDNTVVHLTGNENIDGYKTFLQNVSVDGYVGIPQTSSIFFNTTSDPNWRMGINILYAKSYVGNQINPSGNSLDILVGAGQYDGFTIGNANGSSVLEIDTNGRLYTTIGSIHAAGGFNTDGGYDTESNAGYLQVGKSNATSGQVGNSSTGTFQWDVNLSKIVSPDTASSVTVSNLGTDIHGTFTVNGAPYGLQQAYNAGALTQVNSSNGAFVVQNDGSINGQLFDVLAANSARIFGAADFGGGSYAITMSGDLALTAQSGAQFSVSSGTVYITDAASPIGTLFQITGSAGTPTYFRVNPTNTTINNTLIVDGYTISPVNATSGQALVYNGTAYVPNNVVNSINVSSNLTKNTSTGNINLDLNTTGTSGSVTFGNGSITFDAYGRETSWTSATNLAILQSVPSSQQTGIIYLDTNSSVLIGTPLNYNSVTISGSGTPIGIGVFTPSVDTAASGALNIGTTHATSIVIGKNGLVTSIPGTLSVDGYLISPANATVGQALVYDGTQYSPQTISAGLSGSIADKQIAFGNGATITGSNNLEYDSGTGALKLVNGNFQIDTSHYINFATNDIFWQMGRNVASLTPPHTYTKVLTNGTNSLDILLPGDGEGFSIGAANGPIANKSAFEVRDDGAVYIAGTLQIDGYTINTSGGATNGDILAYNGTAFVPTASATPYTVSFMQAYASTNSSSHLANGDHIEFDNSPFGNSAPIVLDTSTAYSSANGAASIGRFTLTGGKTYRLVANAGVITTAGTNAQLIYQWYDVTSTPVALGQTGIGFSPTSGVYAPCSDATAYYGPGSNALIEVRIVSSTGLTGIGDAGLVFPWVMIETI